MMPRKTLAIAADVRLQVEDEAVHLVGEGSHLILALPSLKAGALLLQSNPFKTGWRNQLRLISQGLRRAGLTVEVYLEGRPWALLGATAKPGALARLLRLGSINLRPGSSLRAVFRHRAGMSGLVLGLGSLLTLFFIARRKP